MSTSPAEPKLYAELADWWPLVSPPAEYAEEALTYWRALESGGDGHLRTILELGSGGGSNAWHLKARATLTLVDRSPAMLAVSAAINPECEHREGDMRSVRLGREFDAVFIHDAIAYTLTDADLRAAITTAWVHCRPGGRALFVPDCVRENFQPTTTHGGHDGGSRALRYLAWAWDPDPNDTCYSVDHAFMMRDKDGSTRVELDRHVCGLFATQEWLAALRDVGFEAKTIFWQLPSEPGASRVMFLGVRRSR